MADIDPPVPASPAKAALTTSTDAETRRIGFAYLGVTVLSYGGLWPTMRLTVELMPPFWFAVTRIFIGAAFLFVLLALTRRLRLPTRADMPAILSVGICMMGLYVSLVHYAVQFVPAGRGALLAYSTPLWVTPVAVLLYDEKLTGPRIAGLALGLVGLGVLFNPAAFDWSDPDILLGNALLLLAAFLWSFAILQMRGHKWNLTPLQLGPWQLLLATVVALPFALFLETRSDVAWGGELFALVAYGGLIGTAIAMFTTATAVRMIGAMTASIGLLGCPVVAITLSVLFLGEPPTATLLGGLVLIVSGIALVSLPQRRR